MRHPIRARGATDPSRWCHDMSYRVIVCHPVRARGATVPFSVAARRRVDAPRHRCFSPRSRRSRGDVALSREGLCPSSNESRRGGLGCAFLQTREGVGGVCLSPQSAVRDWGCASLKSIEKADSSSLARRREEERLGDCASPPKRPQTPPNELGFAPFSKREPVITVARARPTSRSLSFSLVLLWLASPDIGSSDAS